MRSNRVGGRSNATHNFRTTKASRGLIFPCINIFLRIFLAKKEPPDASQNSASVPLDKGDKRVSEASELGGRSNATHPDRSGLEYRASPIKKYQPFFRMKQTTFPRKFYIRAIVVQIVFFRFCGGFMFQSPFNTTVWNIEATAFHQKATGSCSIVGIFIKNQTRLINYTSNISLITCSALSNGI